MPKTYNQKLLYKGFLKVEQAQIEFTDEQGHIHNYSRERLIREDAVGVLIYNKESKNIVLTRQFRYAVADKTQEQFLEIMAGKVDQNEDPIDTAIRETQEECGYIVKKENLNFIASVFASPGYTSERVYLYYTEVTNQDKLNEGGGLQEEHEFIEVVEIPLNSFMNLVDTGSILDAKTLLCALWLKLIKSGNKK